MNTISWRYVPFLLGSLPLLLTVTPFPYLPYPLQLPYGTGDFMKKVPQLPVRTRDR